MAEIVIVTWDGGGNVPPALAIAAELESRGHGIRVLGHAAQRPVIEAAGFRRFPPRRLATSASPARTRTGSWSRPSATAGAGRDLLAELSRHPADLVLVDALTFGALDAARASGVRYAVLEHFYDGYFRGLLRGPLGLALRAKGLRPGRSLRDAAVRIVTSLPELDPVSGGGSVRQVGPLVTWGPRVEAEPTVLVSLSTFGYAGMRERLQDALDGCAGLRREGRGDDRPARRPRIVAGSRRRRGAPVRASRGADAARERRRRSRWSRDGDARAGARRHRRGAAPGPARGPRHGGPQPGARRRRATGERQWWPGRHGRRGGAAARRRTAPLRGRPARRGRAVGTRGARRRPTPWRACCSAAARPARR